jgi:sulfur-oxidizing protein SoxY
LRPSFETHRLRDAPQDEDADVIRTSEMQYLERAMMDDQTTRRNFLALAGGAAIAGALPLVTVRPANATPAMLSSAIRNVVGEAAVRPGKVKLDIPPLVENGNTVPMTVSVISPMTAEDHVKSIHVFNEKNPQPNIGNFYLSPASGRAQVSTRIRLADSQKVVAIARLSDDSFWSVSVDVVVTLAACTEEVL